MAMARPPRLAFLRSVCETSELSVRYPPLSLDARYTNNFKPTMCRVLCRCYLNPLVRKTGVCCAATCACTCEDGCCARSTALLS